MMSSDAVSKYALPKVVLRPAVPVSPFIRFCRWSLLITGITYGVYRHRRLKKKECLHRTNLRQQKVIWDEEQRKLKMISNREELLYLGKETGVSPPKNFDELYPIPK